VKNVGSSSSRRFFDDDTSTKFEVTVTLSTADPRLRPGLTAHIFINSDPQKNVLYVPRQALFLKENKRVVYVKKGGSFDPREVKILAENESRAAIDGIGAGTEIALVDPMAPSKTVRTSPSGGGGAP
jgi:hypothetical protein